MSLNLCRWCGKLVKKVDEKVLLDFEMKFYDHKVCNLERWETRRMKYPDILPPREQPKLRDF